jgi:folate-binding protein YgfZ
VTEDTLRQHEEALGAAFVEVAGRSIPLHYGTAADEYQAVRTGVGVTDRSDLALIRMWGRDPVKMLQGLITNDLAGAPLGQGVYAAMLTPKGRTIAELRAFSQQTSQETEVWIVLPREALSGTREHLKKFVPPMFARWADVTDAYGVIGAYGARSRELLDDALGLQLPDLQEDGFVETSCDGLSCLVVKTLYAGGEDGYDIIAPSSALPALWDVLLESGTELGVRPVGWEALETLRIEAGQPRYGAELTEETIPTEAYEATGLLPRAISFTKGCYTGQEVIVRIAHRGHVNRHLRGVLLGDSPAPAFRTPLINPETGKEIGWTASAAYSPLLDQTVALAYIRREIGPGSVVRIGAPDGAEAVAAALPFTEREREDGQHTTG